MFVRIFHKMEKPILIGTRLFLFNFFSSFFFFATENTEQDSPGAFTDGN
jgi:hypothetical protein